ncbi:hypothetical protein C4572_02925 [Candidatus Parcubacteria bacterium]|nr:MAG: hypothetical protein C4572_02925 [Candidatus Parcubacteria bacterium]
MVKNFLISLKTRFTVIFNLFDFLIKNKMWWLIPMIIFLLLFFVIMLIGQSSPLGPFIYTIF